MLAIDLEGSEVCDWLTAKGVTCVLLKYRVTDIGPYPKSGPYPESPMALEDAQRTIRLIRMRAAQWHIDPHKIGVLGFSAGGHLSVAMSVYFDKRIYAPIDAADKESCRPDFAVAIYPGHLSRSAAEYDAQEGATKFPLPPRDSLSMADDGLGVNPNLHPNGQTPPTFFAAGRRRSCRFGLRLAVVLHRAEEGRRCGGDAPVCAGQSRVWIAAYRSADYGLAAVG